MTITIGMCFFELLQILFRNVFDLLDIEEQANSEFQLYFSFVVLEHLFSDAQDIQIVGSYSLDKQLIVLFGPVKSFLGVEVSVVQSVVFVADLWA